MDIHYKGRDWSNQNQMVIVGEGGGSEFLNYFCGHHKYKMSHLQKCMHHGTFYIIIYFLLIGMVI